MHRYKSKNIKPNYYTNHKNYKLVKLTQKLQTKDDVRWCKNIDLLNRLHDQSAELYQDKQIKAIALGFVNLRCDYFYVRHCYSFRCRVCDCLADNVMHVCINDHIIKICLSCHPLLKR